MSKIDHIKELLKENPNDSFLKHAMALEYIKVGNDTEAKIVFEDLLQQDEEYIGSYYHLAKLLERMGKEKDAIAVYEKGIDVAKQKGEQHALSELRSAYEDLIY